MCLPPTKWPTSDLPNVVSEAQFSLLCNGNNASHTFTGWVGSVSKWLARPGSMIVTITLSNFGI